jgi:hypothetical protein
MVMTTLRGEVSWLYISCMGFIKNGAKVSGIGKLSKQALGLGKSGLATEN